MEMLHVWALAGALGTAALAAIRKAVEYRHELKMADKEIARLGKKIDLLNEQHDKRIAEAQALHATEKEELLKRVSELEKGIAFHDSKPLNYPKHGFI